MTTEEKYEEIVKSRQVAEGKGEESKSGEEKKADPQAEQKKTVTEPEKEGEEKQPQSQPEKGEEKVPPKTADNQKKEQEEHAFASLRFENKKLKERIKNLEDAQASSKKQEPEKLKSSSEFSSDDEYRKYLYEKITKEVTDKVTRDFQQKQEQESAKSESMSKLNGELESAFGAERAKSVMADLRNPESVMSEIITDERAKGIAEVISSSKRRADMLALMQAKPQIFQELLDMPVEKQKYRMFALEDAINKRYSAIENSKAGEEVKREQASNVPVTGTFGVNGNEKTDFSTMSAEARVARYKEELLKNNRR